MLCYDVCECRIVGHDMCVRLVGSVTVYAGFVGGVINPFVVCGQHKVILATKPAEVHSVHRW